MEGLGINFNFLLSQVVNFLILFVALYFLLWKRVLNALDARRQRIQEGIEKAEQADQELARAQTAYDDKVAEGETEAERIKAEAQEAAGQMRASVLKEARAQAEQIRATAQAKVDLERQHMLKELRGQVVTLAIAAANKVIGEALDEQRQQRLVQEFFSGIQAGRVVALEKAELANVAAESAKVTSALPLSAEEQTTISESLAQQLRGKPKVEFAVDPAILGGVVVRVGDIVIDGSVAGQLTSLRASLTEAN